MSLAEVPSPAACGACAAAPSGRDAAVATGTLLSLPHIHCAACITGVEGALRKVPGVNDARVNLTLKRASVDAPGVPVETLVAALGRAGYEAHELDAALLSGTGDRASRDLLMRLAVAGFAMMNVMLLSVAVWSGATDATRDLFHWISAAIAIPTLAFSGQPFFRSALRAVSAKRLNMDVPISLALILAAGLSVYETLQSGAHAYFDAALSLTFFLLGARFLDMRMRHAARSAAEELSALEVPRATRLTDMGEEVIAVAELRAGDLVRVRPGARFPADGVVSEGASEIDRSFLTGESLPVAAGQGDDVHAGEVNLTGLMTVRVTAAGQDTTLARMRDLVALAEGARTKYTPLADRAAAIYAPAVHLLALFAFVGWVWATGDVRFALNVAVATLIITCPCALGLAVPAVATAATGRLYRRGLLVKSATALERLAEIDTVVFDKTGTLTEGRVDPVGLAAHDDDTLAVARALAEASSHPLARSLAETLAERGIAAARVEGIAEQPGHGVEGRWQDRRVRLGRADWTEAEMLEATATYLDLGDGAHRAFRFTDRLRPGAAEAVGKLEALGVEAMLLSGDNAAAVADTAERAGLSDWRAGVRPDEKQQVIADLAAQGRRVLMVGDGLNDTAALAAAHASISPASALDAARVVSDIVLLGNDLTAIPEAVETGRAAVRRIRENFGIAAAYNAVAIPVALAGFATPLAAALAMSTSSISVSLNALRVRR
ncbi:heavy metal translocating P-type ATPase [Tranquillimonas alkanivorans]|uniref:Cu2+-exporting ATPase n=1 Tax=Tranquillimonas alkanivorans TaxID=441119 RepID=A0A1I5KHH1_9RHOB|nr:heavy metal translocating P-type ATPase [Tranquillimonas alkanivorans]SFO84223.1 Cu2+-exporting ATPase [Tranquillimonas alkanivorans]